MKANIAKYKGNPNRMFIWAHSAGNGPLGVYIGHPERWKNGVQVKGAIFMSGVDIAIPGIDAPVALAAVARPPVAAIRVAALTGSPAPVPPAVSRMRWVGTVRLPVPAAWHQQPPAARARVHRAEAHRAGAPLAVARLMADAVSSRPNSRPNATTSQASRRRR